MIDQEPASCQQRAVVWYPPCYDIRVESIPIPKIEDPDDAIIKIKLAGLCGSDLHIYRGHGGLSSSVVCGHEFIGEVVALGTSFNSQTQKTDTTLGRPTLYSTLSVGDKVVSPFTTSCGECHYCHVGFTCRCPSGRLFGTPSTPGGQAQYVRVPKAGGTLYSLSGHDFRPTQHTDDTTLASQPEVSRILSDNSLLLMCDILPTGVFAAFQALSHPKVSPMVRGMPYPLSVGPSDTCADCLREDDARLNIAVLGLGPVGMCTCISLLDMLATRKLRAFRVVGVDLNQSRREKMKAMYAAMGESGKGIGEFVVASVDESKDIVKKWTDGIGCNAVIEVVGNNGALSLAYELVRTFGCITSVGVHGESKLPFTGQQMYGKNVSLDFGRCPVRAMFPMALELLIKRQDVFSGIGGERDLVEKVVGLAEAAENYDMFDKGLVGKVLFDPWK